MEYRNIVLGAHKIIKEDAQLISMKEGILFWNEEMSGLSGWEKQQFNRFHKLEMIEFAFVNPIEECLEDSNRLLIEFAEMTAELREALILNPDKNAFKNKKLIIASQMVLMWIMSNIFKIYRDGL